MKLSKSILSPNHARDPPLSLPISLSRRLKANGSMKGGQSPATFPSTTGKKCDSGFDNPEPSSPKVTCIGQVKMKTKKKVKQSRSLSNRRRDGVSFRKLEQAPEERGLLIQTQRSSSVHFQPQDHPCAAAHRNQRWVHLPLTIYEALREFSCLFPCRSSCFTTNDEKEKEEKVNGSREVTRWFVALQDGEVETTRGIELVIANGKEDVHRKTEEMQNTMRSSRRHVFEDIEFKDIIESVEMKEGVVEEENARVRICIPPKNALLLMRCRSDPMKMADITHRFWESPTRKDEEEDKKEFEENEDFEGIVDAQNMEGCKVPEETSVSIEENSEIVEVNNISSVISFGRETKQEDEKESEINALVAAEVNSNEQVLPESIIDQTRENIEDNQVNIEPEKEAKPSCQQNESILPDCLLLMMCEPKLSMEVSKETWVCSTDFQEIIPEEPKRRRSIDCKPAHNSKSQYQPLRSMSSMATMIEQKLVNAVAYEPFVLTRCKSEPMRRTAATAKVAPESCFWKNRKMEPHRQAAGLGF